MRYRHGMIVLLLLLAFTGCGKTEAVFYDSGTEELPAEAGTEQTEQIEQTEKSKDTKRSVWVYVCGSVKHPGVYELSEGSRITDAIEAAGGMTEEAADTYLNLAETLSDGQKIEVPSLEEAEVLTEAGKTGAAGLVIIRYRETKGGFGKPEDLMKIPGIKEGVFHKIRDQITV